MTEWETKFKQEYSKLNSAQKQAVEAIEGPVMVVAGPGTGKTQIIAMRIANILRQTQMNPWNILALTFTDSASHNMRDRLTNIIGPAAYQVNIHTFHSFANEIIQSYPYTFKLKRDAQPIDELQQIEILEKIIETRKLKFLRPTRDPFHYLKDIIKAISKLKNEHVSPQDLIKLTRQEQELITNGQPDGKIKKEAEHSIAQLDKTIELGDVYLDYDKNLRENGWYDYDDMVLLVLHALEQDKQLLGLLQEKYQYILVDEYQDTNSAQNDLITLVSSFFSEPNLFVVGDEKQAIFRFQGASLENILAIKGRYPNIKLISLVKNYRSHQHILDASHALASHNSQTLEKFLPKVINKLIAEKKIEKPISIQAYLTNDDEVFGVVQAAKKLIDSGVEAQEIAIIYKQNREAAQLADLLARLGIAFAVEKGINVLNDPEIKLLRAIIKAVANPNSSIDLFYALHAPNFKIDPLELLKIASGRLSGKNLFAGLQSHKSVAVKQAIKTLANWQAKQNKISLPELLEEISRESGILARLIRHDDSVEKLNNFDRFFEEVKQFSIKNPDAQIPEFLDHIDRIKEHSLELFPKQIQTNKPGVKLMTAHKAKGLEFDYVFIMNATDKYWGKSQHPEQIKLPKTIITRSQVLAARQQALEDDRRLLYVAITRARRHVTISYSQKNSANQRDQLPSQFITELQGSASIKILPIAEINQKDRFKTKFLEKPAPKKEAGFTNNQKEYLINLATVQPLNPTGLNTYLKCPKEFYYQNLLRVPAVRTASQGYGTAVHLSLQEFFLANKKTKKPPTLNFLTKTFNEAIIKEFMTSSEREDFTNKGLKVLTAWYEKYAANLMPAAELEYSFNHKNIRIGDIPITGKIDKIELLNSKNGEARVVDYKTGHTRTRNQILGLVGEDGGDYFRQLVFYKLLCESDKRCPYKITQGAIAFVDDDAKFNIEMFDLTQKDVLELTKTIEQVHKNILALKFDKKEHAIFKNTKPPLCELLP